MYAISYVPETGHKYCILTGEKIILIKKSELSHCVPHAVHSETVLFFPINNIIFRIIIYLFNQNK